MVNLSLKPKYPSVAIEVGGGHIAGVSLSHNHQRSTVQSVVFRGLSEGVVLPEMVRPNIHDTEAFREVLREVKGELNIKDSKQVSLLLPDNVAKIDVFDVDPTTSPLRKRRDVMDLIRWRVGKTVPYEIERAKIDYHIHSSNDRIFLLSVVILNDVLAQYENEMRRAGLEPGLVDLTSFNTVNQCVEQVARASEGEGEFAVLNSDHGYFSLMIFRGESMIFYRRKDHRQEQNTDGSQLDLQYVIDQLHPSIMYYQDKLDGKGLSKILLRGTNGDEGELALALQERYGISIEPLDLSPRLSLGENVSLQSGDRQNLLAVLGLALGR